MRERPLLMSAPMIRAILNGRKTQTRRVIVPQPPEDVGEIVVGTYHPTKVDRHGEEYPGDPVFGAYDYDGTWGVRCPYGAPGDRLWVRERWCAWALVGAGDFWRVQYAADQQTRDLYPPPDWNPPRVVNRTMGDAPSIHMPRWASRVTLEITEVRVQRVQEITAADARAEGHPTDPSRSDDPDVHDDAAMDWYRDLWDSVNAERDGGAYAWARNPFVWAISFRRI